ncbi:hypothetical protein ASPFODRAFT_52371 [Aspergillus luchuensis CBS 106.47]|uniref:Uncharacterized protein n=1 Tax=Aspergillus luchuensis (strain CBS 106.47) TaxID=1137211 RepID=A0A1M3T3I0_ASPLC|nr:hypothetical protein ASPFODRAFT_52371 [Aspergillus luchuensis CBS 106.47]
MKILKEAETKGSISQFLRTWALMLKGNLAPAGNFHLSFMFGPLIFESGLKRINHGMRVSPRMPPSLLSQTIGEAQKVSCPFFYRHKETKRLEFQYKKIKIKQRPLLACVKRVYGGAFSGYPESARLRQARVIDTFVKEANAFGSIAMTKMAQVRANLLSKAAGRVNRALKECLGGEVNKHLDRIVRILVEKQMRKGWNMWTNSCQWLVMRLLSGEDFDSIIPRFPDNVAGNKVHYEEPEEARFRWPRYLLSFGPNIEGFNQSFYQPKSMITDFCQSRPTIDYDLIEHISLRLTESASPHNLPTSWVHLSLLVDKVTDRIEDTLAAQPPKATTTTFAIPMDALWAMPGETLSMLQFHLLRQPSKYHDMSDKYCLTQTEWSKNRFLVLEMLDTFASLAGALGATLVNLLSRDHQRLSQVTIPNARVFGNILADEQVRIIRLSSRWIAYDITNRVPSAMGQARRLRQQLQKAAGELGDPVHGEEVLSTLVDIFLTPLALVGGRRVAENLGQIFRFHHNGPWITLNGFEHTLVCPLFLKKAKTVRG